MNRRHLFPLLIALICAAAAASDTARRTQDFHVDPQWEGYRNRLLPDPLPMTRQYFGYRANPQPPSSNLRIGGWVNRSVTPAYYAKPIPTKTLENRLSASGKFAVPRDGGNSGVLFGWFNKDSRGWRTPNSLVFRLDGNSGKYWVFFEYGTRHWLAGGAGCFEGPHYQTTRTKPFPADGTVHEWSLGYDPAGSSGSGEVTFVLDGKAYRIALAPGQKADGAEFNRFGMLNLMASGGGMEAYYGDLVIDGQPVDLGRDPGWEERGNRVTFPDRAIRPLHDFGYSPTAYAGGKASGEVGGLAWRDERPAYYADRVGPLTLDDELYASGRLAFTGAGSDSGITFGWFDSTSKRSKTTPEHVEPQKNTVGIMVEGPSRIGHYFRPVYTTRTGAGGAKTEGPIIRPDSRPHTWSIRYSPQGDGVITVELDGERQAYPLRPGHRQTGATFDRFGFFNLQSGGHYVSIYLDDLVYTAGRG